MLWQKVYKSLIYNHYT